MRITATTNQFVTLGTQTIGTLPIYYRWRRIFSLECRSDYSNVVENSRTHFATFPPSGLSNGTYTYALALSNIIRPFLNVAQTRLLVIWTAMVCQTSMKSRMGSGPTTRRMPRWMPMLTGSRIFRNSWRALTPQDASSFLKIDRIAVLPPVVMCFGAISNRTYTIQYSEYSVGDPWHNLADLVSQPTNGVELIYDVETETNRFCRVVTPRVP